MGILLVYVDDIVLAGPKKTVLQNVQTQLSMAFKLKTLGEMKYFLGLEVARSPKGIMLTQRKYTLQLLDDTGNLAAKPQLLPMDPNAKINATEGEKLTDITMYRRPTHV